mmetsp:Transcript_20117/g.48669  ORF Transcript_20117/g.48669 Transcript_20117/m.48669 type:complete len:218 (+) Transcript_20117:211-864(+)
MPAFGRGWEGSVHLSGMQHRSLMEEGGRVAEGGEGLDGRSDVARELARRRAIRRVDVRTGLGPRAAAAVWDRARSASVLRFDEKLGTWDFLGSNQTVVSAQRIQQGQDRQQAAGLSLDKVLDPEAFLKHDAPSATVTPNCTAGTFLNLTSSRCVACSAGRSSPAGAVDSSECSCAGGSYYDAASDLCVCPEGRIFAAGTTGLSGCLCAVQGVFTNCD